jgi:hypothetical protein
LHQRFLLYVFIFIDSTGEGRQRHSRPVGDSS